MTVSSGNIQRLEGIKNSKLNLQLARLFLPAFSITVGHYILNLKTLTLTSMLSDTVTAYTRLRIAIKTKLPGMLTDGVILLHDNASPHITNILTSQILLHDNASPHITNILTSQIAQMR
ncbi:hypothetical protein QE152_g1856 [Popillia japonica]|uniref:Transposase n=1 Tax=Popillia japonica TaxID=7064 RepID=A0AAW1N5A4_POPJA